MAKSDEEKLAERIVRHLDSATLDLDRVGLEIARLEPKTLYNRFILVAEAAVEEQEKQNERYRNNILG
jgi:hypothetical protein